MQSVGTFSFRGIIFVFLNGFVDAVSFGKYSVNQRFYILMLQDTDIQLRILYAFLNLFVIDFETFCYGISDKFAVFKILLPVVGNYFCHQSSVLVSGIIYKFTEVSSSVHPAETMPEDSCHTAVFFYLYRKHLSVKCVRFNKTVR